jgi:amino acid transporter
LRPIDRERQRVEYDKDRAQKIKRLLILFATCDLLILIKLIYNLKFSIILEYPIWSPLLIIALGISIYLSWRLWSYERIKKQELVNIREAKIKILADEKEKSGF